MHRRVMRQRPFSLCCLSTTTTTTSSNYGYTKSTPANWDAAAVQSSFTSGHQVPEASQKYSINSKSLFNRNVTQTKIFYSLLIFMLITVQSTCANSRFSVYRIMPQNEEHLKVLQDIRHKADELEVNFWKTSPNLGHSWDVMVEEGDHEGKLMQLIDNMRIPRIKTINDVEKLIIKREHGKKERRLKDDSSRGSIDLTQYHSYDEIVKWLKGLQADYPSLVRVYPIGKSRENRTLYAVEVGQNRMSQRIFYIDGGIHAREWAASHSTLYFIHQLTARRKEEDIAKYLRTITFVIVPCVNPDGYEFTRSSTNPHIRLWRKNRSPLKCSEDYWGRTRCCRGVDLNRNFDFHFRESGSSSDPCSEIYEGEDAFSEPETRAVRDLIMSQKYKGRVDAFITLHTYSQIWIHPYGHKKDSYPADIKDLLDVGRKAAKALQSVYNTKYVVGSGADTLYPASGGSEDWAKHEAKVKYVYLLELRPDEKMWDGFILPENELIPTAKETWAGIKVVADAVLAMRTNDSSIMPKTNETTKRFRFGNGTDGSCFDVRHACKKWVADREDLCQTVPIFMRANCAYSCGNC